MGDCCWKHDKEGYTMPRRMIVCSQCYNKRCPRATDCSLQCTRSNEPGQKGSIYGEQHGLDDS